MANAAIATVVSVVGKAYARNADGELRELRNGDVLVEGETVVNPDGGRVELSMTDGSPLVIDRIPEMTLTRDLIAETAAGPDESAVQDETVDQVLAALESGEDLGDVLEATAAGASGGDGGEGNSFVRLGRIAEDTSEFSGLLGSEGVTSTVTQDEDYLGVDANDDSAETEEGEPVVIDVKDNDIFPVGGSVTAVTQGGNGTVVINADNTVTYTPDAGFYGEDEFTYTVVSADGGGTDLATVRVNVTGEPAQLPTISIGDDVVVEGDTATLTIALSQVSTEDVTVSFSTADGSATIVGEDYNANNGTVTIKAGELSTTVNVSTNPDNVEEGSENLFVNLSSPVNATIADGEGEIIITDDYLPPTISINDATVTEGDLAILTVSLSRAIEEDVTFRFDSADGSATVSGGDYNPATGVVTIPAGTTEVTISAQTNADNLDEASEQFTVDLSEVTNASVADGTGVVTIVDDFTPPVTPPTTPPTTPPPIVDPNLPPVAVDDTASTEANTPVDINVLPNDSDPDGDAISITGFTQPANGSVVQNPDGTFTYTPDSDFSGNDGFTYTITDGEFSSTADVNIFVDDNPIEIGDENPLARGIQRVLDEALLTGGTQENPSALKGEGSFGVTSKDGLSSLTVNGEELIDGDGALLQGTIVTDSGDHVQVTFTSMDGPTADGVYTINYEVTLIKPFANDPGSDSVDVDFVIAALDTDGDAAGPVTRSATIQDDNPIANDDSNGIVPEDEGLINGDVFLGDASGGVADLPGADGASITSISFVGEDLIEEEKAVTEVGTTIAGDYGDLTIKSDGTYEYQLNQAGVEAIVALDGEDNIEEQFTYVLTDGDDDSDPAILTITLDGRNDPPVAVNDETTTNEDTPVVISVLTNDSDPDGDLLDIIVVSDPVHGSVVINNDNTITYTPDENYNGEDTFEYTISDGKGGTDKATVNIAVQPVNDLFADDNESVTTAEDTDKTGNVLDNVDPATTGDGLVEVTTFQVAGDPAVYNVTDTATITGVGTLTIAADGAYTFSPQANYNGPVPQVIYSMSDDGGLTVGDTSTLDIAVQPVNDLFADDNESVTTAEDTDKTGNVLDNVDPATTGDGLVEVTTFQVAGDPTVYNVTDTATITGVGTLTIAADGAYTFSPQANYNGPVPQVTYSMSDDGGLTVGDTSTLDIAVQPVNDLFADDNESVTTAEDTDKTGNVLDNVDPATTGDGLVEVTTFQVAGDPAVYNVTDTATITGVGTLTIAADGAYTFSPQANYNGPVPQVIYSMSDDGGLTVGDTSTLDIAVQPVNDLFADDNESVTTAEDTDKTGNVLDNVDPATTGDGLVEVTTFQVAGDPTVYNVTDTATITGVGTLTIAADGAYTFSPQANYNGPVPQVTYSMSDDGGLTVGDTSTLDIAVQPVNDLFADDNESVTTAEDTDKTGNVLDNVDPATTGDGLVEVTTFQVAGDPAVYNVTDTATITGVGTLTIAADGAYTFSPQANYNGPVPQVIYSMSDDGGLTVGDTSTLDIAVQPVNDLFADDNESVTTAEDTDKTGNVLDNVDPATTGDGLVEVTTFQVAGDPAVYNVTDTATITGVGTLTIAADGAYTFSPQANYNGPVPQVTYSMSDDGGLTVGDTSTLDIAVQPVNDLPEIDMSLSGMDVDEGHLTIGNDYVDPQTSDPKTTDTGSIGFKTGDQPFTLNIGSATFTTLAAITAANGTTLDTEHGTLTFGALTGPVDGTYTLAYSYQLDEAEGHSTNDADPGQDRILVTLVDNDGDNVGDQYITVGIVDDKPVGFDPDSAFVVDGSGVASGIPLNFSNSVGADDFGSVVFSPIAADNTAKDINGNVLKIEGKPLFFYTSDDGLELTVATANPYDGSFVEGSDLVALTFEVDGDTYTLTSNNGVISNGTDLSDADLSGVRGGNSEQLLLIDAFESSSSSLLDVLASGVGNSNDNTVNSNDFSMGVGAGNDVDFGGTGDILTLEFVSGLSATDEFGNAATTYESRVGVNNFKLPLLNVRNDATLTVTLYNGDISPENLVDTLNYDTNIDGLVIPDSVDSRIDNYFTISTAENFTTVVIEATGGNFKVGQFALTEFVEGQPVNISVGVTGVDSDDIDQVGDDSVDSTIDVTVQAANDNLVDASTDPLIGTSEDDIFTWELADATSENDVVVGFGAQGNDILDLRDILQLEDSGAPGEIGNLQSYLSVSLEGSDTVIGVSSAGAFAGVPEDVNFIDQTITLQNVDLVSGNGDLEGIIQNMLDSGKLLTD